MYCEQCGTEVSEDAKFCSNCGHKLDESDTLPEIKETSISNDSLESEKEITSTSNVESKNKTANTFNGKSKDKIISTQDMETKTNNKSLFKTKKDKTILIALIIFIVIFLIAVFTMTAVLTPTNDNEATNSSNQILTPSFTDNIYGINFQIPEGYKTISGTDNQNKGTMITYDRSYMGPDVNEITISVSTTKGNFYWDLTQNRDYSDVETTINGHTGVLKSSGLFSYVDGDKLVVIQGASQDQLKSIIIE